jgi:hypothetical protein
VAGSRGRSLRGAKLPKFRSSRFSANRQCARKAPPVEPFPRTVKRAVRAVSLWPAGLPAAIFPGSLPDFAKMPFTVQIFTQPTTPLPYFPCSDMAIFLGLTEDGKHCRPRELGHQFLGGILGGFFVGADPCVRPVCDSVIMKIFPHIPNSYSSLHILRNSNGFTVFTLEICSISSLYDRIVRLSVVRKYCTSFLAA